MQREILSSFNWNYRESIIENKVLWESHCHAQFEMICVLEGDVSILLEGRSYRVKSGQTIIIPPLYYHTITSNKTGWYRRITMLFEMDAVPSALHEHFSKKDACLTLFSTPRTEELVDICRERNPQFYDALIQSMAIGILYEEVRKGQTIPLEIDETLQAILSYIDTHLNEKILLRDLANHAACSESTVSHLFGEKMKISPKQYILQKKMALAEQLIRNGMPATLAAMQVGYDNYSNFYRIYRNQYKTTPTQKNEN